MEKVECHLIEEENTKKINQEGIIKMTQTLEQTCMYKQYCKETHCNGDGKWKREIHNHPYDFCCMSFIPYYIINLGERNEKGNSS